MKQEEQTVQTEQNRPNKAYYRLVVEIDLDEPGSGDRVDWIEKLLDSTCVGIVTQEVWDSYRTRPNLTGWQSEIGNGMAIVPLEAIRAITD